MILFSRLIFVKWQKSLFYIHFHCRYRRRSRIPGLKTLAAVFRWVWPSDRCANCQSIYSITRPSDMIDNKSIDQIHRSTDGRFVITYGSDMEISRPQSATGSNSSESDDGGFFAATKNWEIANILATAARFISK